MDSGHDSAAHTPLSYAEPSEGRRVRPLDLVGHVLFGLGLALVLGGYCGQEYRWGGPVGDILMQYYPHMMMIGGFLSGLIISLRLGPFPR